nr:Chain B, Gag Polyprotein [Human immunodeficiency virus 1]1M4Q_B Chain B, Gag Polyprotein [Human immunodeficiency virus 1]3OBU_B Chain B, Gag polyprotein [synthetic construct]
PEPTAPPEE